MSRIYGSTAVLALTYLALYCVGNTDGRRWLYLIVTLATWVVFAVVARRFWLARRDGAVEGGAVEGDGRLATRPVLLVALLAAAIQLPGMFFAPVSSTDLNRYVWDGRVQLSGVDPYRYVPFDDRLAHLRDPILFPGLRPDQSSGYTTEPLPTDRAALLEVAKNYPEQTVLSRPRFPTPYPPVAEAYYTAVSAVTPWSWGVKGFQLAGAALAVATAALVSLYLRARGRDPLLALLFAWCPTVVLEAGNGGHVDILVAFFIVLAVLAAQARRGPLLVGLLVGLAAGVKLTPFVMLPGFVSWKRLPASAVRIATAIGTVVLSYLPHFLAVGTLVLGSIGGYVVEENGENRASLLQLGVGLSAANLLAVVITLGVACWAVFRRRTLSFDDPALPALVLLGTLLFTTTPVLAWYSLPLLALATMTLRLEWFALGVAGVLAYGGHSYFPMTPVGYAAALLVVVLVWRRRSLAAQAAAAAQP
ncbi:glycosyltransferase 87 family protein [Arsenicicoccus piscis]|nr:glycosyltransferase 87 family protein [Arsenicicoccus piscis]